MALDARQPLCLTRLTKIGDLAIQSCDVKACLNASPMLRLSQFYVGEDGYWANYVRETLLGMLNRRIRSEVMVEGRMHDTVSYIAACPFVRPCEDTHIPDLCV